MVGFRGQFIGLWNLATAAAVGPRRQTRWPFDTKCVGLLLGGRDAENGSDVAEHELVICGRPSIHPIRGICQPTCLVLLQGYAETEFLDGGTEIFNCKAEMVWVSGVIHRINQEGSPEQK